MVEIIRIDFALDDTPRSMKALLRRLGGAWEAREDVRLDLANCQYLGPDGLVVLASLVHALRQRRVRTEIVPPRDAKILAFCHFSGLLGLVGLGVEPDEDVENVTVPVRAFTCYDQGAIHQVVALVNRFVVMSKDTESALTAGMSELIMNILDHAQSPVGGLVAARAFRGKKEVRFAIADLGRSIPGTMRNRFPDLENDGSAMRAAFGGQRSTKSRPGNLGLGLHSLNEMVRANRGRLYVISRAALASRALGKRLAVDATDVEFPGTLACVSFRIDNRLYGGDSSPVADVEL